MRGRLLPPPRWCKEVQIVPKVRVLRTFRRGDTGEVCRRGVEVDLPAKMAGFLARRGYCVPVSNAAKDADKADGEKKADK